MYPTKKLHNLLKKLGLRRLSNLRNGIRYFAYCKRLGTNV